MSRPRRDSVKISVRLPAPMLEKLKALAPEGEQGTEGYGVAELIRRVLHDWLTDQEAEQPTERHTLQPGARLLIVQPLL